MSAQQDFGGAPLCEDVLSRETLRELLTTVGDKWSLVVVASLDDGPVRFTDLLRGIDGISHRVLTKTLRDLERDGFVARAAYPESPPRVEYSLTPLGRGMVEPILTLVRWTEQHQEQIHRARRRFDASH